MCYITEHIMCYIKDQIMRYITDQTTYHVVYMCYITKYDVLCNRSDHVSITTYHLLYNR